MFGIIEVFLCCCVLYYFYNKNRTVDMVDVLHNRLKDYCESFRFPGSTVNELEERVTVNDLQRFGQEGRKRRIEAKIKDDKNRDRSLYLIKEAQQLNVQLNAKPVRGLACRHCAPSDSETQLDPKERRRDAKDILRVTQHAGRQPNSSNFDWGVWFPHMAQVFRLRKFKYPQMSGAVINDDRLITAIEQAATESMEEENIATVHSKDSKEYEEAFIKMQKKHEKRAKSILYDMRSKISDLLLRITSWVLYKLLPCFMSGVAAHPAQIDMLKAASERSPGAPLIFLPLHRSHLDYILISFILLNNDIKSPIVAAGNNLRIPFFGALLRGLGAFFIKRKIDPIIGKKDTIYRAVLHTYLQQCLSAVHNVELFIEGGRTRTGKPCMPKSGILSVIVEAFMDGTISDALLVPVSVNYEKLVDGNFIYEQLGQKKQPETFKSAISAIWKVLHSRYGLMRIDFNEPFSIRELVKSFNKAPQQYDFNNMSSPTLNRKLQHNPSTSSLYGTDIVQEEHRSLVDSIARHVIFDCASAAAVMTTNAVAFLFLTRFRDGVPMNVLSEALDELRTLIQSDRDLGFTGNSTDVINYAVGLLGPDLVTIEKRGTQQFLKAITNLPNVIELSYYSNSLLPHFALESIMITALHDSVKQRDNQSQSIEEIGIERNEVLRKCLDHCEILKYEFIFCKPCQNIYTMLEDTMNKLVGRGLIYIPVKSYTEDEIRARNMARILIDSDEEDEDYLPRVRVEDCMFATAEGHCERIVLMTVLAPIGHTYLAVAFSLNQLLGGNTITESEFVKVCIKEITARYESGICKYGESISVDSIRNCVKLLEKWSVLEISSSTGMRTLSLGGLYDSLNGVESVIERIQRCVPFCN